MPVNTAVRRAATMGNAGDAFVGGTAFLGPCLPLSMRYSLVSYPGVCQDVGMDVTPTTRGDAVLYISADSANVLRETNELDSRASAILTAY